MAATEDERESIGRLIYGGTLVVSVVLRAMAGIVLAAGAVLIALGAADSVHYGTSSTGLTAAGVGISSAIVITVSALLAAAGCALSVLVGIFEQVWESRFGEE